MAESAGRPLGKEIDSVERAYEYMLAYAAQGRRGEDDGPNSTIRTYLEEAAAALRALEALQPSQLGPLGGAAAAAAAGFLELLRPDARKARLAFELVLAQDGIGSQAVDNLNASMHVRTLLTDLFLLDETLKRAAAPAG